MDKIYCYIAVKKCGCIVGFSVDDKRIKKDTSVSVAQWIKDGLTVERVILTDAGLRLTICEHKEKAK